MSGCVGLSCWLGLNHDTVFGRTVLDNRAEQLVCWVGLEPISAILLLDPHISGGARAGLSGGCLPPASVTAVFCGNGTWTLICFQGRELIYSLSVRLLTVQDNCCIGDALLHFQSVFFMCCFNSYQSTNNNNNNNDNNKSLNILIPLNQ